MPTIMGVLSLGSSGGGGAGSLRPQVKHHGNSHGRFLSDHLAQHVGSMARTSCSTYCRVRSRTWHAFQDTVYKSYSVYVYIEREYVLVLFVFGLVGLYV